LSFRALRCHPERSEGSRSAQGKLREESRSDSFFGPRSGYAALSSDPR